MNNSSPYQEARSTLKNMPPELFDVWLDERIEKLGWPPCGTRWDGLLRNRPLSYWQGLHWTKELIPLSIDIFDSESQYFISMLIDGAVDNSNYVTQLTGNSGPRIKSIYKYIEKTGTLPNSIIIVQNQTSYTLVDGCHRMAILSTLQAHPDQSPPLQASHSVWIGK